MPSVTSYRSPKVELKGESKIADIGIFAIQKINQGELVAVKNGYILSKDDLDNIPEVCKAYLSQIDDNLFLGPKQLDQIQRNGIFINHSCNPNVGVKGQITFFALRDIIEGEELTLDYSTHFTKMMAMAGISCNCGSKQCRGRISGEDWKLKELQDRYGDFFSEYILRKIR